MAGRRYASSGIPGTFTWMGSAATDAPNSRRAEDSHHFVVHFSVSLDDRGRPDKGRSLDGVTFDESGSAVCRSTLSWEPPSGSDGNDCNLDGEILRKED